MAHDRDVTALDQLAIWAVRWAHGRAAVIDLLGALNLPGGFTLDDWSDFNTVPMADLIEDIMAEFGITREDVVAASNERDRAFQEEDGD